MRFVCSVSFVAALLSVDATFAFAPLRSSSRSAPPTTFLQLALSPDQIKQHGGGIPVIPTGNKELFDPAAEGQLQGTGSLDARISSGSAFDYLALVTPPTEIPEVLDDAQHWLEDIGTPPPVFAKATKPATAHVLGRSRLIAPDAPGDIQHVLLRLPKGMNYIEGQSLSVIPPGTNPATGKKHKPRLYSIASTRYGDALCGETVSLCVRRAVYVDPATGMEDPSKKGVCSNFLCDIEDGAEVQVAGPVGKTMLLPQDSGDKDWANKDIIMVATGTGIAPFRGFLRRLFLENTVARHMYQGTAWLVLGVPTTGSLLYQDEWNQILNEQSQGKNSGNFKATFAVSREMQNEQGGKYYVQDVLAEQADELFHKLLNEGAVIYFCGLKGMMPGILTALEQVATERGLVWDEVMKQLKANGQWHVEVY